MCVGDIRLTPFYDIEECTARMIKYVDELNNGKGLIVISSYNLFSISDLSLLPCRGPCSKYDITDTATGASFRAKLSFNVEGTPLKVDIIFGAKLLCMYCSSNGLLA